jgi:SMC interacting uncharacterized protein involved in chromosome segregation
MMAEEQRFDRVERHLDKLGDKIDELTKVITTMARIEERMTTLFKKMDAYEVRHEDLDTRLGDIEKSTTKRGVVDQVMEKGFWVVIGGGVAYAFKAFGG